MSAPETLSNWRLKDSAEPFDEDEFFDGFEEFAAEANEVFDRAFTPRAPAFPRASRGPNTSRWDASSDA